MRMTPKQAVEYALQSARLEGYTFTDKELKVWEKLANGEITDEKFRENLTLKIKQMRKEQPHLFKK